MEELLYVIVKDILKELKERFGLWRRLNREHKVFLIGVLLDVIRVNAATRHYIRENEGVFKGSDDIKNQFLALHEKMINANQLVNDLFPLELVNGMRDKAFFWEKPEVYSQHPSLLATVPTLDEIDEVCQDIIVNMI
jgi:hypothetical protein